MSTKFERFVPVFYADMKATLAEFVKPGSKILDLGSNEGNIEEFFDSLGGRYEIDAVDIDVKALDILRSKKFQNIEVNVTEADANQYLEEYKDTVDVVLSSASIHEINDNKNQKTYLNHWFSRLHEILNPGGIIIVGDLYHPSHVTREEFEKFRLYQLTLIDHASAWEEFVNPSLIDDAASRHGFSVILKKEFRAVKEIDRRYYVIVLQKN